VIQNNAIGLDAGGAANPNGGSGILLLSSACRGLIGAAPQPSACSTAMISSDPSDADDAATDNPADGSSLGEMARAILDVAADIYSVVAVGGGTVPLTPPQAVGGNTIAYNAGDGITVCLSGACTTVHSNTFRTNHIFQNAGKGIAINGSAQNGVAPPNIFSADDFNDVVQGNANCPVAVEPCEIEVFDNSPPGSGSPPDAQNQARQSLGTALIDSSNSIRGGNQLNFALQAPANSIVKCHYIDGVVTWSTGDTSELSFAIQATRTGDNTRCSP
jgi:hypothetical protein